MRNQQLVLVRGDSRGLLVQLYQPDQQPYALLPPTEVWFTAKYSARDPDEAAVIRKTLSDGGVQVLDGPGGLLRIDIVPADTAALVERTQLVWDLQLRPPSGEVVTVALGLLTVVEDVTRAS